MPKKLTQEEFIERAKQVHGDKYDYSMVEYVNSATKVCIICPEHGDFLQTPNHHLSGSGCSKCKNKKISLLQKGVFRPSTNKICGVGKNDYDTVMDTDTLQVYHIWRSMIKRCYDPNDRRHVTYKDCSVCEEWLLFKDFYKWYKTNNIKGWCLDKDILVKGNIVYSPETCCFVPNEINVIFNKHKNGRGKSSVCGIRIIGSKYSVRISRFGKTTEIGLFNSLEEAKIKYKQLKEAYIKDVANKWKDKIEAKIYKALIEYEFDFED